MAPTSTAAGRRRTIVGVSTKMYFSLARTRSYVDAILTILEKDTEAVLDHTDLFVIPDFVSLASVSQQLKESPAGGRVLLGAQDCGWEDYGAFTGFVSPAVLADVGVRIVEIGHAERRRLLGETDKTTADKAAAAVQQGLVPLVCIGEVAKPSSDAQAYAATIAAVVGQITPVLDAVPDDAEVLLAYEPVWAIGAAQPASAEHVRAVVGGIRQSCAALKRRGASRTRILYGGSAGPGLFAQLGGGGGGDDEVDGLFLGRFGHDPEQFFKTAKEVAGL